MHVTIDVLISTIFERIMSMFISPEALATGSLHEIITNFLGHLIGEI